MYSRRTCTLHSFHGFWQRPMTTVGSFRHRNSVCPAPHTFSTCIPPVNHFFVSGLHNVVHLLWSIPTQMAAACPWKTHGAAQHSTVAKFALGTIEQAIPDPGGPWNSRRFRLRVSSAAVLCALDASPRFSMRSLHCLVGDAAHCGKRPEMSPLRNNHSSVARLKNGLVVFDTMTLSCSFTIHLLRVRKKTPPLSFAAPLPSAVCLMRRAPCVGVDITRAASNKHTNRCAACRKLSPASSVRAPRRERATDEQHREPNGDEKMIDE